MAARSATTHLRGSLGLDSPGGGARGHLHQAVIYWITKGLGGPPDPQPASQSPPVATIRKPNNENVTKSVWLALNLEENVSRPQSSSSAEGAQGSGRHNHCRCYTNTRLIFTSSGPGDFKEAPCGQALMASARGQVPLGMLPPGHRVTIEHPAFPEPTEGVSHSLIPSCCAVPDRYGPWLASWA